MASGCGRATAAGLPRDAIPLYPVMPQLHVKTFRASIMIVASLGRYLAVSGRDHGTVRAEGTSLVPHWGIAIDEAGAPAPHPRRTGEWGTWHAPAMAGHHPITYLLGAGAEAGHDGGGDLGGEAGGGGEVGTARVGAGCWPRAFR